MGAEDGEMGNACTTTILRLFLAGAYTGIDSPLLSVAWADYCFLGNGSGQRSWAEDGSVHENEYEEGLQNQEGRS